MTMFLRPFAPARRLLAALCLAALGSLAFGICLCADETTPPAKQGCHQFEPSKAPSDGTWTETCCCANAATLQLTTLDSRTPELSRDLGSFGADSVAVLGGEPSGLWNRDAVPQWLMEAPPPLASPPSFVLPLRV